MASNDSKQRQTRRWSRDEHDKFLRGLEMFPNGPWSRIAALVGTRTTRQTMTHAQKYRERMTRRANEVNALWDAHGRAANPSLTLLQETVRSLPPVEVNSPSTQLSSSDEELLEDIGAAAGTAELDELDLRILMSLLSPETEGHTACAAVEPMMMSMEAESQHLDHHIWGLLADLADDCQLQGEAW